MASFPFGDGAARRGGGSGSKPPLYPMSGGRGSQSAGVAGGLAIRALPHDDLAMKTHRFDLFPHSIATASLAIAVALAPFAALAQNTGEAGDMTAPEDVAAPPASAMKTPSGLAYRVLQAGTSKQHPGPTDRVTVHYTGWTTDGKMFDSSVVRGEPATFGLNQVIAGWTEGVQLMVEGEKARLWIPQDLAYKGQPGAPAGMLVFDVELLSIAK